MNTKHYLVISGIVGGIIGSLLTTILVSPVTAQRDKFGDIECTSLTVTDAEGREVVRLSRDEHGGWVGVYGMELESKATLGIGKHGGDVRVSGKNGGGQFKVTSTGGIVTLSNSFSLAYDGPEYATAELGIDEFDGHLGGYVYVTRQESVEGAWKTAFDGSAATVSLAKMSAGRYGGIMWVRGVNKESVHSEAQVSATENGGRVEVKGVGLGKAVMGGDGVISTWDRSGSPLK